MGTWLQRCWDISSLEFGNNRMSLTPVVGSDKGPKKEGASEEIRTRRRQSFLGTVQHTGRKALGESPGFSLSPVLQSAVSTSYWLNLTRSQCKGPWAVKFSGSAPCMIEVPPYPLSWESTCQVWEGQGMDPRINRCMSGTSTGALKSFQNKIRAK